MNIHIKVPATSANVGSGFDALGIALNLYNTVTISESDTLDISSSDGSFVPTGADNLIYKTMKTVFKKYGKTLNGVKMVQTNAIPMARGLGSSSACIVAGILAANELLEKPMTQQDVLTLATDMEGHPDNVAPALLGGFVTSVFDEGQVYSLKKELPDDLCFAAFVPSFKLLTKKARGVLPTEIPHKDAVFNLSRSALLTTALFQERYDLLKIATKDTLHQQYRLPLIEGGEQIFKLCDSLGALATYISGAGPTILSIVHKDNTSFFTNAENKLKSERLNKKYTLQKLSADNKGARVING